MARAAGCAATALLAVLTAAAQAQSLYVDGADPYAASRHFRVGDLIEIRIDENLSADRNAQQNVSKSMSLNAGFSPNQNLSPGTLAQVSLGQSGSGAGSTVRSDQMVATITVMVTAIQPDGSLQVKGNQTVDLDGEVQKLTLSGLLQPEDVGLDRTADSQRLGDVQMTLSEKGTASRGGTLGWLQWLLSFIGL